MTTFTARPAIDPTTGKLVIGAEGHAYAEGDTGFSTPLATTDLAGVPLAVLKTTPIGTTPDFIVGDVTGPFTVVWRSGVYAFVIDSPDGLLAQAAALAVDAAAAAGAASTAAGVASLAQADAAQALAAVQEYAAISVGLPTRAMSVVSTVSLATGASWQGTVGMAPGWRIYRVSTNRDARVRFYATGVDQAADVNRAVGVDPVGQHGVQLDIALDASVWGDLPVDGYSLEDPLTASIPVTVTNLSSTSASIHLSVVYLPTEGLPTGGGGPT